MIDGREKGFDAQQDAEKGRICEMERTENVKMSSRRLANHWEFW